MKGENIVMFSEEIMAAFLAGEDIVMFPEEIIAAFLAEEMDEEDAMEELEEYGIDLEDYDDEYDEW